MNYQETNPNTRMTWPRRLMRYGVGLIAAAVGIAVGAEVAGFSSEALDAVAGVAVVGGAALGAAGVILETGSDSQRAT